jgi:putative methyltransferase (TIGR04325 family)
MYQNKQVLEGVPGVRWMLRAAYDRRVRAGPDKWQFWSAFPTYHDAVAAAEAAGLAKDAIGYESGVIATRGRSTYEQMYIHDYAALWWLARFVSLATDDSTRPLTIVDLGGHYGEKYRVFRHIWQPARAASWIVLETSSGARAAAALPPSDQLPELHFTADRGCLNGATILYASGSLQYIPDTLWEILDAVADPPMHIVLNKLPLSEGRDCWTIQNAWTAVLPYHVFNRDRFLSELAERGYRPVDEWKVPN